MLLSPCKNKKGKGYTHAENEPDRFHGVGPFNIKTGESTKNNKATTYTEIFSKTIMDLGRKNDKIVAISAAMPDGTGSNGFSKAFPDRFFDGGIAEGHCVTFAAGMAKCDMKPIVAIYSTFLQRAYDEILHDVCINNLPVTFAIDRAGLVGQDGETHQGVFDISFLSHMPNMTVMAPKNRYELEDMLHFANNYNGPLAIRYPRGNAYEGLEEYRQESELGKAEVIYEDKDQEVLRIALGSMVETAVAVRTC